MEGSARKTVRWVICMQMMKTVLRTIDWTNKWVGASIRWLAVGMIVATSYEVLSRYLFGAPTLWAHQTVIIMGGALVSLSWGWVHLHGGHVRMDILHRRLSPRAQAISDVVCALLFFFPLIGLLIYVSGQWMIDSWAAGERWTISIWKPLLAPSRTGILFGLILFFLQGLAMFIRDIYFIVRGERP